MKFQFIAIDNQTVSLTNVSRGIAMLQIANKFPKFFGHIILSHKYISYLSEDLQMMLTDEQKQANGRGKLISQHAQTCYDIRLKNDWRYSMTDIIHEDAVAVTGDLFVRNMRKVLIEEGFTGEALENKIKELMQKDVRRLAAVILG